MSWQQQTTVAEQPERIQVELECGLVKIRTERFDRKLGWYTAASLSLHPSHIGLLEEALQRARAVTTLKGRRGVVIPFPSPAFPTAPAASPIRASAGE